MAKFYVEYSGYTCVEGVEDEAEAVETATEQGLLDLDMDAYTPKEWKRHTKVRNERNIYYAMELTLPEDIDDENEVVTELYDHLRDNGYHFFLTSEPGFEQILVLLIWEEETGYIDTILEDRGIKYEYIDF